jgi:hypothetical protein
VFTPHAAEGEGELGGACDVDSAADIEWPSARMTQYPVPTGSRSDWSQMTGSGWPRSLRVLIGEWLETLSAEEFRHIYFAKRGREAQRQLPPFFRPEADTPQSPGDVARSQSPFRPLRGAGAFEQNLRYLLGLAARVHGGEHERCRRIAVEAATSVALARGDDLGVIERLAVAVLAETEAETEVLDQAER